MKKCTKCNELKDLSCYSKAGKGLKPACKSCYSKAEKARRILKGGTIRIDRSGETPGTRTCTKCVIIKPIENFTHPHWCQSCIKIYNREVADKKGIKEKFVPIVTETGKQCCRCKEIKDFNLYTDSARGTKGKAAYCKECMTFLQVNKYTTKEERGIKTQKYRDDNREWWRFLHRVNQFNRRQQLKTVSDGTVDKEFIITLYETVECYFCKKETTKEERTCEHLQPLVKGGIHGISNIVMSCLSCNTSKGGKTEQEYYEYLKRKNNDKC